MSNGPVFLKYLEKLSLTALTPIQELCLSPLLEGKSVVGLAPTGSGKTIAFILPLLLRVDCTNRSIQKLVLVPTRELGMQIAKVCRQLSDIVMKLDNKNVLIRTAFGGTPAAAQAEEIAKNPHIVIGTPGRILDLMDRKAFLTSNVDTFVLDEADIMMDMGFCDEVEHIFKRLRKNVQVNLFSATESEKVTSLEKTILNNKDHLVFNAKEENSETSDVKIHDSTIEHQFVFSHNDQKETNLVTFLKSFDLKNKGKTIIFCHQKDKVMQLTELLKENGFFADALTGDHGTIHRNSIMRNFTSGNLKHLVATNIAARGIDINKLAAVIHFDVPFNKEDYIHRSGRTGRSGFDEGISVTFCDARTKNIYLKIMEQLELSTQEIRLSANKNYSHEKSEKVDFTKIHLNKGKQNKIRPGDIVGALINECSFTKEDIGSIFIFTNFTQVEVNVTKKKQVLNKIIKIKNLAVKAVEVRQE